MNVPKKNNVPILKTEEIDSYASLILNQFNPNIIESQLESPLESIIEKHFRIDLDYQYLSNNGCYLGMTTFNDQSVPVTTENYDDAYFIEVSAQTILIEQSLVDDNDIRYRFTLAHELGHALFHHDYFYQDENQMTLFDVEEYDLGEEYRPLTKYDIGKALNKDLSDGNITELDWIEWQANAFASSILIPKKSLITFYRDYNKGNFIYDVSKKFNTSVEVAKYRCENLGLI